MYYGLNGGGVGNFFNFFNFNKVILFEIHFFGMGKSDNYYFFMRAMLHIALIAKYLLSQGKGSQSIILQ